MERLTKRCPTHITTICGNCEKHGNCFDSADCSEVLRNRLAAYEDIELKPEEIEHLKNQLNGYVKQCLHYETRLNAYRSIGTVEEFAKLVKLFESVEEIFEQAAIMLDNDKKLKEELSQYKQAEQLTNSKKQCDNYGFCNSPCNGFNEDCDSYISTQEQALQEEQHG